MVLLNIIFSRTTAYPQPQPQPQFTAAAAAAHIFRTTAAAAQNPSRSPGFDSDLYYTRL